MTAATLITNNQEGPMNGLASGSTNESKGSLMSAGLYLLMSACRSLLDAINQMQGEFANLTSFISKVQAAKATEWKERNQTDLQNVQRFIDEHKGSWTAREQQQLQVLQTQVSLDQAAAQTDQMKIGVPGDLAKGMVSQLAQSTSVFITMMTAVIELLKFAAGLLR